MTVLPVFLAAISFVLPLIHCVTSTPLDTIQRGGIIGPGSLTAPISNCATFPEYEDWFQPSRKFDVGDCPKAIQIFYHDYVKDHKSIKYEFLAHAVDPTHGIPTQRLPLRVSYGTCNVVCTLKPFCHCLRHSPLQKSSANLNHGSKIITLVEAAVQALSH